MATELPFTKPECLTESEWLAVTLTLSFHFFKSPDETQQGVVADALAKLLEQVNRHGSEHHRRVGG